MNDKNKEQIQLKLNKLKTEYFNLLKELPIENNIQTEFTPDELIELTLPSISEIILIFDTNATIVYINQVEKEYIDYIIIGMSVYSFLAEDEIENYKINVEQAFRTKKQVHLETKSNLPSGNRYYRTKLTPTTIRGKEYIVAFIEDITHEVLAKLEKIQTEFEYRALFENAYDTLLIIEPYTEVILQANKRASQLYGFELKELIGKSLKELTVDPIRGDEYMDLIMKIGNLSTYETIHINKEGQNIYFEVNASKTEYNKKTAILVIARDISERKISEEKLRKNELFLNTLIDNIPVGIQVFDKDGFSIRMNEKRREILRLPNKEYGNNTFNLFKEDVMATSGTMQYYFKAYNGETVFLNDFEVQLKSKDWIARTEKFFTDIMLVPIKDENNKVEFVISITIDVTERHIKEQKLKENEELLRSINTNIQEGLYRSTEKEGIIYANEAFIEMFGYDNLEDIKNRTDKIYADPNRRKEVIEKLKREKFYRDEEIEYKRKDGSTFWGISSSQIIELENGEFYLDGAVKDITERKMSEQALQFSELRFRTIIQNAPEITILVDQYEIITYLSPSYYRTFNFKDADNLAINLMDLFHHKDKEFVSEIFKDCLEKPQEVFIFEARMKDNDNSFKILEFFMQNFLSERAVNAIIIHCRDISAQKEYENQIHSLNEDLEQIVVRRTKQLEEAIEKLKVENLERLKVQTELENIQKHITEALKKEKELSKLKTRFVSMVSHEYRTPLTIIQTATYLLENYFHQQKTVKFKANINKIQNAVENMLYLLENVLTAGKFEFDKIERNITIVDIKLLILDLIDTYSKIYKHKVILNSPNENIIGETDAKLLYQILNNLISNALKFSINQTDVIIDLIESQQEIIINIIDHGIGINEDDKKRLMQPFHRGQNVDTVSGTGLGLAIAQSLIDILEGKLNFTSEEGHGSQFTITLPKKLIMQNNL